MNNLIKQKLIRDVSRSLNGEKVIRMGTRLKSILVKKPSKKALIFIHGFRGSTNSTFNDFHYLFRNYNQFLGYDIFFYGYDSLWVRANISANQFCDFIDYLHDSSDTLYLSSNRLKKITEKY
ncbi:MAG: hypothetical protein IPP71_10135 [Bacteroidetes bacterium]|nr:hypothetical protein [Bacteroidota bacterium]